MAPAQSPPPPRPFTGVTLDRLATGRKDPDRVAQLLADPGARAVVAGHEGVVMTDGTRPALVRATLAPPALTPPAGQEPVLLGLEGDRALFALDLDSLETRAREALTAEAGVVSLREAGTVLEHHEAGLAAYAAALLNWHRRHGFCPNCGSATAIVEAGYARHCPVCRATHFPRTDPVVIMTVEDRGRLLLGRRAGGPPGRYSVLAGFVSPGESAEEAVVREVAEESGIVARDPHFVTSQPWPFPSSLMLGFDAKSDGGEPENRDRELEDVRWVPADEVRQALAGQHPWLKLPPSVSVARFLIERWAAGHQL